MTYAYESFVKKKKKAYVSMNKTPFELSL